MKLVRWNPNRGLMDFHSEFDRVLENLVGDPTGSHLAECWVPAADLKESEEGFTIDLDLPGVEPKDVKVSVQDDVVWIRGERRQEQTEGPKNWHRTERVYGSFERSFRLGTPLDAAKVKAAYRSGVITVSIPKAESAKPREIEVEVSA